MLKQSGQELAVASFNDLLSIITPKLQPNSYEEGETRPKRWSGTLRNLSVDLTLVQAMGLPRRVNCAVFAQEQAIITLDMDRSKYLFEIWDSRFFQDNSEPFVIWAKTPAETTLKALEISSAAAIGLINTVESLG